MRRFPATVWCGLWVAAASCAAAAPSRVVRFSEDFEGEISLWRSFNAGSRWEVDARKPGHGQRSLRVDVGGGRSAALARKVDLSPPAAALEVTYLGRVEKAAATAQTGVDLRIDLDDGTVVWFMPQSLRLKAEAEGRWVTRQAVYVAPPGKRIAAFTVFCLNYEAAGAAWFDDIVVASFASVRVGAEVSVLSVEPQATKLQAVARAAGLTCEIAPAFADVSACRVVIVPQWREAEDFYFRLKVYHYLGGRLVLCHLPSSPWATALSRYLWDCAPAELGSKLRTATDGRAVHAPSAAAVTAELLQSLAKAEVSLPASLPTWTSRPKSPARIRQGALYLEGRPFFVRAVGCYRYDQPGGNADDKAAFAAYSMLGFNAVVVYTPWNFQRRRFAGLLDEAWRHRLRVIVYLYGPPASPYSEKPLKDEWLLRALEFRSHPALLQWILCDDTFDRHRPFVARECEVVRRYDRTNLVTATLMDPRHPEALPEAAWRVWRQTVDFPLTYLYPLQKGETYGGIVDIKGGLEDVQRLADHVRQVWGEDVYHQQWCQAHMQTPSYPKVGLSPYETVLPSAEQQRLLTYMMLAAGARGVIYFGDFSLRDGRLGAGRRAELGRVWTALQPVEELLASGKRLGLAADIENVEAVCYQLGGDSLVLLVQHARDQNRCVGKSSPTRVTVRMPWSSAIAPQVVQLEPGGTAVSATLAGSQLQLVVPDFDLAEAVLLTPNAARAEEVRAAGRARLSLLATCAVVAAVDKQIKTDVVFGLLPLRGENETKRLRAAAQTTQQALAALRGRQWQQALRLTREAFFAMRAVQMTAIQSAERLARQRDVQAPTLYKTNIFFSLPAFYAELGRRDAIAKGDLRRQILARWRETEIPGWPLLP